MADARNRIEPVTHLTGSVPSPDQTVKFEDLRLQHLQMGAESSNTRTCDLGQSFVIRIGNDAEQLFDTSTSDRRDDAKLRKMSADRIDHRSLLANEEVTR